MSSTKVSRPRADEAAISAHSRCSDERGVSRRIEVMPRTPFIGVRSSWLMLARNCDLSLEAAIASWRLLLSSADCAARACVRSSTLSSSVCAWSRRRSSITATVSRSSTASRTASSGDSAGGGPSPPAEMLLAKVASVDIGLEIHPESAAAETTESTTQKSVVTAARRPAASPASSIVCAGCTMLTVHASWPRGSMRRTQVASASAPLSSWPRRWTASVVVAVSRIVPDGRWMRFASAFSLWESTMTPRSWSMTTARASARCAIARCPV